MGERNPRTVKVFQSEGPTDSGIEDLTLLFITGNMDELERKAYYLMEFVYVPVCQADDGQGVSWLVTDLPIKTRLSFRSTEFAKAFVKFKSRIEEWTIGTKDGKLYTAYITGVNRW